MGSAKKHVRRVDAGTYEDKNGVVRMKVLVRISVVAWDLLRAYATDSRLKLNEALDSVILERLATKEHDAKKEDKAA